MELSPEEYGAYWGASLRVAAGILVMGFGYRLAAPLLSFSAPPAVGLGVMLVAGVVVAGSFLVVLGLSRAVRAAVSAELRR
ncbi:hypothetical protein ACFQGT_16365 [Natrialbaceae archaeon GCM10025810]|uniref:hypothetical protein n=1 Tax=Halovalidus salilacus TaxID=3075124 RepID=UPI00361A1A00